MNFSLFGILGAAIAVALPGVVSWWWGRRLIREPDDPALPERLVVHRGRVAGVAIASGVASGLLISPNSMPLLFFNIYLATLVGGFPARRRLFGETWDLGTYLGHAMRALVAFAGPSLLLALTPSLIAGRTGTAAWVTAVVLFVVLVTWQRLYHPILLRLLEARELDRPDLAPRFAAIVSKSSAAPPRLWMLDPKGGRWANAVALPRLRPPSAVVFTRTLLDELTPAESAAIFAHEVAHLEHYDKKRLRRIVLGQVLVALLVCTIGFVMPEEWGTWRTSIALIFAPTIILATAVGIARRRGHEGESDLRAVELCGDAEALASALGKLHALARLPRRIAAESEAMHSHPSLARRLQAIRNAGGIAKPTEAFEPLVVRGESGKFVVLDRERAHWLEGIAAPATSLSADELRAQAGVAKSYAYGELMELRLDVGRGRPSLVARTRSEKWSLPLESPDAGVIGRLQAKLDELDGKLGAPRRQRSGLDGLVPLVSLALLLFSIAVVRSLPAAGAAALALIRPAASTLGAAAGASIAAVVIALFAITEIGSMTALHAVVAALAIVLLWIARGRRDADEREVPSRLVLAVVVLVVAAIPSAIGFVVTFLEPDWVVGSPSAMRFPGVTVALVGIAAALVFRRRAGLASVAAAAAVAPFLVSPWIGGEALDPLHAPIGSMQLEPLAARAVNRFEVPLSVVSVRSSPSGAAYALELRELDDEDFGDESAGAVPAVPRFEVGPLDGARATIEGFELGFLDDHRVLVVAVSQGKAELREVDLRAPDHARWKASIPYLLQPHLAVDPGSAAFRLVGKDPRSRSFVRLRGRVGDGAVKEDRWVTPTDLRFTIYEWYPTDGARVLALGMRMPRTTAFVQQWMIALVDPTLLYHHELWALGGEEPRRIASGPLALSCVQPAFGAEAIVCTALEGQATKVFSIVPSRDALAPIASVGRVFVGASAAASATRLAAASGSEVVLLDLAAGRGKVVSVGKPGGQSYVRGVALADGRLAVLEQGESASVTLFDLPSS